MAAPPEPTSDPEEVRRLADEILDRPEFGDEGRSWLERLLDWVARQLDRFLGDGAGAGVDVGGSQILSIVLLVVAVVLVVLVLLRLRGSWRGGGRGGAPAAPLDVDVDERRPADAWDDLAARLEAEGRWKEALRAQFGALVERLRAGGVVADVPGRTTGEYRADVRASLPDAADAFAEAADLFDRAWYGDLPTGPDEAGRFAVDAERVLAASGGRR